MLTEIGSGREYIEKGARLIKAGEIVAFPTETVYGLGADAFNPQAVDKIFKAKGRPSDNPLIVHLCGFENLGAVVSCIPDIAEKLYRAFCPGPLTMVMKKSKAVPDVVTAGLSTVGVRFPSHPAAIELIKLSTAIAAPSANLSKHVSPTTARHVYEDLGGKIPLIIDGGSSQVGIESTIIDISGESPVILRPGTITLEMINSVCNAVNNSGEVKVAIAPGMKYLHYSPRCDCVIGDDIPSIIRMYQDSVAKGTKTVILAKEDTIKQLAGLNVWSLGSKGEDVARRLYALLREGEKAFGLIIVESLGDEGIFYSVMNRVNKAVKRDVK